MNPALVIIIFSYTTFNFRLYKCLSSGSYSMTFSEINTRILIFGMYMTAFFLCTGPMYGWGEYSQFKGTSVPVNLNSDRNVYSNTYISDDIFWYLFRLMNEHIPL